MTYTYDPTTNIGRVRRSIPDRVEADAIWSDEEIQSFLDDEGGNWRRATATILETMASDSVLVLQVIRIHNIETDGAKMSAELLKRAKGLRDLADVEETNEDDGGFAIAEIVTTESQYRDRLINQALRGVL